MRLTVDIGLVAAAALAVCAATATAGPIFDEPPGGDAGNTIATAEDVKPATGEGDIGLLKGEIKGSGGYVGGFGDFQDLYRIYIADPLQCTAQTCALEPLGGLRDPMLYLFDEQGRGIRAMNKIGDGELQAKLVNDDGNGNLLFNTPGIYYLAITSAMRSPSSMPSIWAPFSITARSTPAANALFFHCFFTDLTVTSITLREGRTKAVAVTKPVNSSTA